MTLIAAINAYARPVTLSRRAAGAYDADGQFVEGAVTTVATRATVQPVSGRERMELPEGARMQARWTIWSATELLPDDRITFGGETYEVQFVMPRSTLGQFWRATLMLVP